MTGAVPRGRRTLARPVVLDGKGLFSARRAVMRLCPAPPGTGLRFVRTDHDPPRTIPAHPDFLVDEARHTVLGVAGVRVETVEHVLAACAGLGVDDLLLQLDGPEVPHLDGSARPFVHTLHAAGLITHARTVTALSVTTGHEVTHDGASLRLHPADPSDVGLTIDYRLEYGPDSGIGTQRATVRLDPSTFADDIAPARTFTTLTDARALQRRGIAAHLTARDALVYDADGPVETSLRLDDECARHKILDLVGDLALLGRPLVGRIEARRSGHALNHALVRALEPLVRADA
ncbi:MAG: UDP-3-O-acyl-N-acetylglucosamine deacetylase [Myxococcota bacterium]